MPRRLMLQAGIDPDKTMKRVAFSGAHDATAWQVAGGKVDAGALSISMKRKKVAEKKTDVAWARVFYAMPPYFDASPTRYCSLTLLLGRSDQDWKNGFDSLMCRSCDTFTRVSGPQGTHPLTFQALGFKQRRPRRKFSCCCSCWGCD